MTDFPSRFHGIIPPVVTPLNEDRTFDRASAERLYRFMLDAGASGLFLFGSSGEGPLLSEAMRRSALETAVSLVAGRVPVLAGAFGAGTDQTIEAAKVARALGADAVVVTAPYYFPHTQEEILAHFRAVREAVDLPIVAYDIPRTVKVKLALPTLLQLAREGTVVGVKDSSGDQVGFRQLLVSRPAGFRAFTGAELFLDQALFAGADGSVPGLSNVGPELFVAVYNHWRKGEFDAARRVQERIARLFACFQQPDGTIASGYAIGTMKAALKLRGVIATSQMCRPFPAPSAEQEERTRRLMEEAGIRLEAESGI